MSLHLTFNNMRQSEAVSAHIHDMFEELIKITDNKFPFHVRLNKEGDETYHVGINCNYHSKQLVSNVDDSNLYKALGKSIESIKHQVLKKSQKLRKPGKESKSLGKWDGWKGMDRSVAKSLSEMLYLTSLICITKEFFFSLD